MINLVTKKTARNIPNKIFTYILQLDAYIQEMNNWR